jgi:transposase
MIVALSQSGRGTKELSDEYDLNASMISRWHREYNSKSGDLTKKSGLSVDVYFNLKVYQHFSLKVYQFY